ncbi:MAG: calcium/sodium antiporter [Neomegalonema sp.]|nr:calcium/sodium antiporter [Neomegalonema sp.]
MLDAIELAIGLTILLFAGDLLVKGAVAAGLRFNVPPILIGLTIVAFGTSAPELFVTIQASIENAPGLAVGNVVGSNIANVLLVLGLPALLAPMGDHSAETQRNYKIMCAATLLSVVLLAISPLSWWQGLLLLGGLGLFLYDVYRHAMAARATGGEPHFDEIDEADTSMPGWKVAALVAVGVIGLPLGAHLAVESARSLAASAGVSDEAIGLTVIALGTSLPELATTVMAAIRKRGDIAIGNVIGSNVFNLLCILGVAATLDSIPVPADFYTLNIWVMVASAAALAPFVLSDRRMSKTVGAVFLASYVAYIAAAFATQRIEKPSPSASAAPETSIKRPVAAASAR